MTFRDEMLKTLSSDSYHFPGGGRPQLYKQQDTFFQREMLNV